MFIGFSTVFDETRIYESIETIKVSFDGHVKFFDKIKGRYVGGDFFYILSSEGYEWYISHGSHIFEFKKFISYEDKKLWEKEAIAAAERMARKECIDIMETLKDFTIDAEGFRKGLESLDD